MSSRAFSTASSSTRCTMALAPRKKKKPSSRGRRPLQKAELGRQKRARATHAQDAALSGMIELLPPILRKYLNA